MTEEITSRLSASAGGRGARARQPDVLAAPVGDDGTEHREP